MDKTTEFQTKNNTTATVRFWFGYDTENIRKVMDHVEQNYDQDDYHFTIAYPEREMYALDINIKQGDDALIELIKQCDEYDPDEDFTEV